MLQILLMLILTIPVHASFKEAEKLINKAISKKVLPGAVLAVGRKNEILVKKAYGKRDLSEKNSLETIYDLASLTKIITATSVLILEEQGKLKISDKVGLYIPHFNSPDKDEVTLEDLLRHRGGLPSGLRPLDEEDFSSYVKRMASIPLSYTPGKKTVYSDLGLILLGLIVQKVSGVSLEEFTKEHIFNPLKMKKTSYVVEEERKKLCAPTLPDRLCVPHDPTAFHFYPHTLGHAGVFSTLDDVLRLAKMFLNGGELEGTRILKKTTVKKMIHLPPKEVRGLGFDLLSPYATAPRGEVFPEGISFGHTGYTGTTLWIDPKSHSFYVFLSNRVFLGDGRTKKAFTELRKSLSTAIGKAIY